MNTNEDVDEWHMCLCIQGRQMDSKISQLPIPLVIIKIIFILRVLLKENT
jgi:hypothetical protein